MRFLPAIMLRATEFPPVQICLEKLSEMRKFLMITMYIQTKYLSKTWQYITYKIFMDTICGNLKS